MYRIELSPGEETAFRSIEELAVAIRRGVVTARARVWHNASGKWLPIQFHPHYKIAASMQLTPADLVAGPPVKPLELLTLGAQMDPPPPVVRTAVEPPEPERPFQPEEPALEQRPPEPKRRKKAAIKSATKSKKNGSGGRPLRLALAGALLIGGAHLVISAASAALSRDVAILPPSHRRLVRIPANTGQDGRPETTAATVLPGLPAVPRPISRPSSTVRPLSSAPGTSRSPAATEATSLASQSEAATPPLTAFHADPESIQPAPAATDIAAPAPPAGDSIAGRAADSTGKKAMKQILRAVGGAPAPEPSRPKR